MTTTTPKAPFPWFGGKSRIAEVVWRAFGDAQNYVEPFAGSLAVLLGRPRVVGAETVNDLDCYLANFWRSVQSDPGAVARWCDYPVSEVDLAARHRWLVGRDAFRERMRSDPDYYDAKIAGWWVWGLSAWIGDGWCRPPGRGRLPALGSSGGGVHAISPPSIADLSARLRRVRITCGDWRRVLTPSVAWRDRGRVTGVLLDPPYDGYESTYGSGSVARDVAAWAAEHGDHPGLRIALCGYEGTVDLPPTWRCVPWKAKGGYGSQSEDNPNASRERVWLSPHCVADRQTELFR